MFDLLVEADHQRNDALTVEHKIQSEMLERLGIEWIPGEPFYALVEDEINRLRTMLAGLLNDSAI